VLGKQGKGSRAEHTGEEKLQFALEFSDRESCGGRPVTDVTTRSHSPSMVVASYGRRGFGSLADPEGCVNVWSAGLHPKPEFTCDAPSPILTAQFHKFTPGLIIGAGECGSIFLWDQRDKHAPVLKTPLPSYSRGGHSHAVYAMEMVGTHQSNSLISASMDGRVCVWSLNKLSEPQEHFDLKPAGSDSKHTVNDISITAMTVPHRKHSEIVVGLANGAIGQVHLDGGKEQDAGEKNVKPLQDTWSSHEGPITSIQASCHDGFDLLLSTSVDGSVRMWSPEHCQFPLLEMDCYDDYVLDAKWHPVHPACFAVADANGNLDLWDLNSDFEKQVWRMDPNEGEVAKADRDRHPTAYNKLAWSPDGKRLVGGTAEGHVRMFTVAKDVYTSKPDGTARFHDRIATLHEEYKQQHRAG